MSFWNDVGAWFTGRNGVYKDDDKVKQAIDDLNKVSSSIPKNLDDPLNKAITELNAVKGFSEYVGIEVPQGFFDKLTVQANDGIVAMVQQIQAKKNDLDEYDNGSILEKIGGTASMTLGKVGEGFLSVFEGIGDAGLTVANWVGSGVGAIAEVATTDKTLDDLGKTFDKNLNSSPLKQWIETDVSGAMMKPLTDNELAAKYSAFTKNSGAASICKGVGKAAGYMTLGGFVGASAAPGTLLANSTNAVTAVTAASAFGQGTETGLISGKGFAAATGQGLVQAAIEGGMAYGAGKLAEHSQIRASNSEIESTLKTKLGEINTQYADDIANLDRDLASKAITNSEYTAAKAGLDRSLQTATDLAKESAATNKGIVETIVRGQGGYTENGLYQLGASLRNNPVGTVTSAASSAKDAFVETVKHPIKSLKSGAGTVTQPLRHPINTLSAVGNGVKNSVTPGNIAATALTGGEAVLGGGTNGVDRKLNLGINSETAHEQFQTRETTKKIIEEERNKRENPDPKPDPDDTGTEDEKTPTNTNKSNDKTGDKTGDRTTGGPSGGSPSGGSPSGGSPHTTSSDAQFKEKPTETNKTKPTETNTASNTSQNNPVPNSASNIVFNNNASNTPQTPNTPTTTNNSVPSQEIVTPADPNPQTPPANPDNPAPGATIPTGGGTSHTGGGYTDTSGYTEDGTLTGDETSIIDDGILDDDWEDASDSISSIIGGGSNFTKLPSNNPIHQSSSGSAVIPVVAGLSAAAAAGIGAKAYMDRKNNNDNGEDDFETEEWTGEDNLDIDYNDGVEEEQYLDDDSDFGTEGTVEKYGARNNDELADLQ